MLQICRYAVPVPDWCSLPDDLIVSSQILVIDENLGNVHKDYGEACFSLNSNKRDLTLKCNIVNVLMRLDEEEDMEVGREEMSECGRWNPCRMTYYNMLTDMRSSVQQTGGAFIGVIPKAKLRHCWIRQSSAILA